MNTSSVETTLRSIGSGYRAGLLVWLKVRRPDLWTEMKSLEGLINEAALFGDAAGLGDLLTRYKDFFTYAGELRVVAEDPQQMTIDWKG